MQRSTGTTLAEIQKELNIPKSTLHGLLQELIEINILRSNAENKYFIGTNFIQISAVCMSRINLVREINIVADDVSTKTKLTINASVIEGKNVTYLVEVKGAENNPFTNNVGLVFPAYSCSMGKMLLSDYSDDVIRKFYENEVFEVYTDRTIKNVDELLQQMKLIRSRGYATDFGEFSPFIGCLAVPVYMKDKMVASMSASIPIGKLTDDYIAEVSAVLLQASQEVSKRLGMITE